jgi:hypothetical protein
LKRLIGCGPLVRKNLDHLQVDYGSRSLAPLDCNDTLLERWPFGLRNPRR